MVVVVVEVVAEVVVAVAAAAKFVKVILTRAKSAFADADFFLSILRYKKLKNRIISVQTAIIDDDHQKYDAFLIHHWYLCQVF